MAVPEVVVSPSDSIAADLRKQMREEIGDSILPVNARFALEQKYGLTDPVLVFSERTIIQLEEGR